MGRIKIATVFPNILGVRPDTRCNVRKSTMSYEFIFKVFYTILTINPVSLSMFIGDFWCRFSESFLVEGYSDLSCVRFLPTRNLALSLASLRAVDDG